MLSALDTIPRDARHLVLFDEIYRSQSMTRSADKLVLSQPTVSIWLGKLRRQLGDPLFVRTSTGVRPTPTIAQRWMDEYHSGLPKYNEYKKADSGHKLETTGKELRKLMSWVNEET